MHESELSSSSSPRILDISLVVQSLASQDPATRLKACTKLIKLHFEHESSSYLSLLIRKQLRQLDILPRLLNLLSDSYRNLKFVAVIAIGNLAESYEWRDMIHHEKKVIQKLVSMLPGSDIDCTKYNEKADGGWSDVAWTLSNLAESHEGNQAAIREFGGIHRLVRLLVSDSQPLIEYTVMAIYRIIFQNEASKMELHPEAIANLIKVISSSWKSKSGYDKTRQFAAWSIGYITLGQVDTQNLIRKAGVIPDLVRMMTNARSSIKSKHAAVWTLGKIADGNLENQDAIREAGAIESIVPLLSRDSADSILRQDAIWTLGSLACNHHVNRRRIGELGLIRLIAKHLKVENEGTREDASWALANLACEDAENKLRISAVNGIAELVSLLSDEFAAVRREASMALGHIADDSASSRAAVRELNAIPVIVNLLADESDNNVKEGAAFAVACLCENCPENTDIVRKEGGLRLLEMLAKAEGNPEVKDTAKKAFQICSVTSTASSNDDVNDDAATSSANNSSRDSNLDENVLYYDERDSVDSSSGTCVGEEESSTNSSSGSGIVLQNTSDCYGLNNASTTTSSCSETSHFSPAMGTEGATSFLHNISASYLLCFSRVYVCLKACCA